MKRPALGLYVILVPIGLVGATTAFAGSSHATRTKTTAAVESASLVAPTAGRILTGPSSGLSLAKSFDATTGAEIESFMAYQPPFTGGVRVATGDVNGDGFADIVTGAGPGGGPHVKVFDGLTGTEARSFFAFDAMFAGGVFVGAADVTGDGRADIVVGPDAGGGPHVRVFDGATGRVRADFFAYDPSFVGGVRVAAGDVDGDGWADILTAPGPGGGPHVKVFDARTGAERLSFFAYAPSFQGGVFVAAGDVTGDGLDDVITGAGAGGGPHVRVFDGQTGQEVAGFFAYAPSFLGGVRVAAGDVDGDGFADIVTAPGPGGGPHVKVFDGRTGGEATAFFAYDPAFLGGVFVAATALGEAAPPPSAIEDLIAAVDRALDEGTLSGTGGGGSAARRARAWRDRLVEAARRIEDGALGAACRQLRYAYTRADGVVPPPDFVQGPAREDLAEAIRELMLQLGCGG